jgi:hypothetical protein
MLENLKEGDTIKIGEKEFEHFTTKGVVFLKNNLGNEKAFAMETLGFLGAEIVRKAPPKNSPIRYRFNGVNYYGVYTGNGIVNNMLVIRIADSFKHICDWEVLEIEK